MMRFQKLFPHLRHGSRRPICRCERGFTLMEVVLSLAIFTMMVLLFGATVPAIMRSAKYGSNYDQAVALAQHKIEQLRTTGLGNPDAASLAVLGLVDAAQPVPRPANPAGAPAGAYSYTFTTVDALPNYFPAGCQGLLTVSPDAAAGANDAVITITWSQAGGAASTYTAKAKIINQLRKPPP